MVQLLIAFSLFFLKLPPVLGHLCTPEDKDFTEFRYNEQIAYCSRNVSSKYKDYICRRDGVNDRTDFTVDHIIPLAIGGSNHPSNLWCQHKSIAVTKLERKVYWQLRKGYIRQAEAIKKILDAKFHRQAKKRPHG